MLAWHTDYYKVVHLFVIKNQKNQNKILTLEDQFVLKNLLDGATLCYNCLGDIYNNIVPFDSEINNKIK